MEKSGSSLNFLCVQLIMRLIKAQYSISGNTLGHLDKNVFLNIVLNNAKLLDNWKGVLLKGELFDYFLTYEL